MKLTSLLSLALICMTAPAAFGQVANTRIAVVNPGRIAQEMKELQDMKVSLESENQRLRAQEDERKLELQKLQNQRDQLKTDSPQWDELNVKLSENYSDFKAWVEKTKMKNDRAQKRQLVQLYERIQQAVEEVAKRDGYDLVISDQHPEINNVDQVNIDQLRAVLMSRSVLFAAPKADISDAVIQQINATYKSKGGTAAPTGAAPAPRKPAPAPAPAPAPKQ